MAAMTLFHVEKCHFLVSKHKTSASSNAAAPASYICTCFWCWYWSHCGDCLSLHVFLSVSEFVCLLAFRLLIEFYENYFSFS